MSGWRAVAVVARRELVERGRERSFLLGTLVTLLILAGAIVIPQLVGAGPDQARVVVASEAGERVARVAASRPGVGLTAVPAPDATVAEARVRSEEADAALVGDQPRVIVLEELDEELGTVLRDAAADVRAVRALDAAGADATQRRAVLDPPPLAVGALEPQQDGEALVVLAFIALFLLYVQLITSGYMIAAGIVEEKASRVVELLLAAIRPRQLLAGKVLGIGLLGLAQLLVVGVVGGGLALGVGAIEVPTEAFGALGVLLAFFLLGYALYATLFAVAGALVPRQEELQSSSTPMLLLLIAAFLLSFQVVDDPGGPLAVALSFVPPCAPLVLPVRVIAGEVAWWEVAGGVALLVASTGALVALAARVYANAVLRTGSSVPLRQAVRG